MGQPGTTAASGCRVDGRWDALRDAQGESEPKARAARAVRAIRDVQVTAEQHCKPVRIVRTHVAVRQAEASKHGLLEKARART